MDVAVPSPEQPSGYDFGLPPFLDWERPAERPSHSHLDGILGMTADDRSKPSADADYMLKRIVPPMVRGSLGVPTISPELPAWIVRFWM